MSEGRLWVRLIRAHKITASATIPASRDEVHSALRELLGKMDLSEPVWLDSHERDWDAFSLTVFRPEHFMEPVPFDRMEISYIDEEDRKPGFHPRNPAWDV